jgi:hypothetical protein
MGHGIAKYLSIKAPIVKDKIAHFICFSQNSLRRFLPPVEHAGS